MFEDAREPLLAHIRAGENIDEAAAGVGVNVHTVRSWLAKGRKATDGPYWSFANEVDALRELQRLPAHRETGPMTFSELDYLLAEKCRSGSVAAMSLWAKLHQDDPVPPPSEGVGADGFSEFDAS